MWEFEDFHIGIFLKKIRERPILWNPATEGYNDRPRKRQAWLEIAEALCEDFEEKDVWEKDDICKILFKKWRNIKDNYIKCLKKRSRDEAGREYVYSRYLTFLKPVLSETGRIPSQDGREDASTFVKREPVTDDAGDGAPQEDNQSCDSNSSANCNTRMRKKWRIRTRKRLHSPDAQLCQTELLNPIETIDMNPSDVQSSQDFLAMMSLDSDRSFFESLVPSLRDFDEDEKLEFRSEVLEIVRRMRKNRKTKDYSSFN